MNILLYAGQEINQRADGYVNATQMCAANDKQFTDWSRTDDFNRYKDAVALKRGLSCHCICVKVSEGFPAKTAYWLHQDMAIKLGRWISVAFELCCDDNIKTLIETGKTELPTLATTKNLPGIFERFRRLSIELVVQDDYFVVATEIQMFLSGISLDYDWSHDEWADRIDGSVAKCWVNYCKANLPTAYASRIDARYKGLTINSYQNEYLGAFRRWFRHEYVTFKFPNYIKGKHKKNELLPVSNKALDFRKPQQLKAS